jgi:isoleucyl-tRNA synthetase
MAGYDAPYVPGWDCHGMPNEVQIEKTLGKHLPPAETLALCRAYATEQIARQKAQFERLGVLGDWDRPYTTMAFKSEADEIRTLGKLLEQGWLYRGLKPVNWCFDCGSALAEAEVEYEDRQDIAIDVGFPLEGDAERAKLARAFGLATAPAGPIHAVIWTTTPWTIPSNQALNAHPEFTYALVETTRGHLVLGAELVERCLARFKLAGNVVATAPGTSLENIAFRHPFYDRASPVYLGDYVTAEDGTGLVHSSPAYGVEDFLSCRRYGMKDDEILNPVLGDGRFAESLPFFGGMKVWDANPKVVEKIRESGALYHAEKFTHSYMHCWRHKTPVIYRATTQWFAGMDDVPGYGGTKPAQSLRSLALAGIEATAFFPPWGKSRLYSMIANRPDWTLSRQRQWGVPMPFFVHRESGALHPRTPEILERVAQAVERDGIEAWQAITAEEMLGADEARAYEKARDTLDVWFDSGSTHQTVMGGPDGRRTGAGSHAADTAFPADLYLEGSDQHRGWFHSSLLVSCMLNGTPPYKGLLTHGFTVDGEGKKMSKSKGNVVAPQKVSETLGAEVLRLWVGATDYSGDLSISDEILKRVVESYRRLRNTLRFLMANTVDFDPARDAVPAGELLEIDRYALARLAELVREAVGDYDRYEYHLVVKRLTTYASEDLGGFYLDVLKDRLYTTAAASRSRRSAQTALAIIRDALLKLLAPILSFTAEEAWRILRPHDPTIFVHTWADLVPAVPDADVLVPKWQRILAVRAAVLRELEQLRMQGRIGSSLQADVTVSAPEPEHAALASLGDDLKYVFITSAARVERGDALAIAVNPSAGTKCERCWHWRDDVGDDRTHPALCGRCVSNLFGAGDPRRCA